MLFVATTGTKGEESVGESVRPFSLERGRQNAINWLVVWLVEYQNEVWSVEDESSL